MSPAKIMIVEDERITAESVKCALEDLGYLVCAMVSSGTEAVEKAAIEQPDLVLMDIVLNGPMDGVEAAEKIRAAHGVPILYVTAYADEPVLRRAKVTAPYGYVIKPFTTRELHSNIEIALHKSRLDRRIARLNAVLDTMRMVNQLVIREHDRDRLLDRVCHILAEHEGYACAWAVLLDDAGRLARAAQAGLGDDIFEPMIELLRGGGRPGCFERVFAEPGGILIAPNDGDCDDCPLRDVHRRFQTLAARVGHGGRTPGSLFVGAPPETPIDQAELALFGELADDISVALHAINVEAERDQAEQAMRHAQKMEAVGQLAAGVAHDFNNLLTVIGGYCEVLQITEQLSDQQQEMLESIAAASDRAATLTRQLLAFSRKQVLRPAVVNLNDIVQDMRKLIRRLLRDDVELIMRPCSELRLVEVDAGQIEHVLMNLVANARDAIAGPGCVRVELANADVDESHARRHDGLSPGPYVVLSVSDTGCGMTEEVRRRAFEPFFTTKEVGKGTGLGLSTAYGIVKQSGGGVFVQSEPERGASFDIYLPAATNRRASTPTPVSSSDMEWGDETVLVVEDDAAVRSLVRSALQMRGYEVLEAGDSTEALRISGQHPGPIQLLVTDIVMPRMDGATLAEKLACALPSLKVLFISGYTHDCEQLRSVMDLGAAHLQKPFKGAELARKVREVLDAAPQRRATPSSSSAAQ